MLNQKIKNVDLDPIVMATSRNIKYHYYYDGSGEIEVRTKGQLTFYMDDGLLRHQLKSLEDAIEFRKEELIQMKQALTLLKKAKKNKNIR